MYMYMYIYMPKPASGNVVQSVVADASPAEGQETTQQPVMEPIVESEASKVGPATTGPVVTTAYAATMSASLRMPGLSAHTRLKNIQIGSMTAMASA